MNRRFGQRYVLDANGHDLDRCEVCGKTPYEGARTIELVTHEVPDGATLILVVDHVYCRGCQPSQLARILPVMNLTLDMN